MPKLRGIYLVETSPGRKEEKSSKDLTVTPTSYPSNFSALKKIERQELEAMKDI